MPKMKRRARGAPSSSATIVRRKFRIGNAKGGKSALQMSTEDLKEVLNSDTKKKFHSNARTVLRMRGVEINWPGKLDKQETLTDLAHVMQANSPA